MTEFQDLSIQIESAGEGTYNVRAETEWAVARNYGVSFPTLSAGPPGAVDDRPQAADSSTRDTVRVVRLAPADNIGEAMFNALFQGRVRDLFTMGRARAAARQRILRIRLHFDMGDERVAALANLPWESMVDASLNERLALSPDLAIARCPDVPRVLDVPAFTGRLRVLFVGSNPRDDLRLDLEKNEIRKALSNQKVLRYKLLDDATWGALEQNLHDGQQSRDPFHIVHFMGHGTFADEAGALQFSDGPRPGREVGELLHSYAIRMVVLNACRTAEVSTLAGHDPFAGVASALVLANVTAVLAMQASIPDAAARIFSERFYSGIARQFTIEEALRSARSKLRAAMPGWEWAMPVMFLRGHGEILPDPETLSGTKPAGAFSARITAKSEAPGEVEEADRLAAKPHAVVPQRQDEWPSAQSGSFPATEPGDGSGPSDPRIEAPGPKERDTGAQSDPRANFDEKAARPRENARDGLTAPDGPKSDGTMGLDAKAQEAR